MEAIDRAILDLFDAGNPRGLARAISRAEGGYAAELLQALFARTGRAITIGLTGPPGVGKSTLTASLVRFIRKLKHSVGVISVDPSSPFSNGAILGDRIRLSEHFTDASVFIRSMASRGRLGGLAAATGDAVALMDAFGKNVIIVETVGVGQSEVEIAQLTDTTIVVLQPDSGDSVQLLKAGILEIADIFVVNKSDHPKALQLQREIRSMLVGNHFSGWVPPLVATRAQEGNGVEDLWKAILAHDAYVKGSGKRASKRHQAFTHRVRSLALRGIESRLDQEIAALLTDSADNLANPYAIAQEIIAHLLNAPINQAAPRIGTPLKRS